MLALKYEKKNRNALILHYSVQPELVTLIITIDNGKTFAMNGLCSFHELRLSKKTS